MLARRELPQPFRAWNAHWDAPAGRPPLLRGLIRSTDLSMRYQGPFAWQVNNTTRAYEYPWAYHAITKRGKGLHVVDVGGSLGGLQWALAKTGYQVTNVDPGLEAGGLGWNLDADLHARLCKLFAPVRLVPKTLADADLPPQSVDVVLSISALEHFSDDDLRSTAAAIPVILKPDGILVTTIDLFLDLAPFSDRESNQWGRNIDVHAFLSLAGLELDEGNAEELHGFPEFNPKSIMGRLSELFIGYHFAMAQCLTARRAKG